MPALKFLIGSRHRISLVVTQPDRPKGRSGKPVPSPVKELAQSHGLEIAQPVKLSEPSFKERFAGSAADIGIVVAYGLLLPPWLLDMPVHGFINVHPSLVPRHRGAAPVERTLFEGDSETAVSILRMGPGLDDGPILGQRRFPVLPDEDAGVLRDRCARIGAEMILETLDRILEGTLEESPQPVDGITYAQKISPDDALIEWSLPAEKIHAQIRALSPRPGAFTSFRGKKMKIFKAALASARGEGTTGPGTVTAVSPEGITVASGQGSILIRELQLEGKSKVAAKDFIHGSRVAAGEILG